MNTNNIKATSYAALLACLALIPFPAACNAGRVQTKPLPYTGISLSGGEFYDPTKVPHPVYGTNYFYPTPEEFRYFAGKGMNVFRFQFLWETLQPVPGKPFRPEEIARLKGVVDGATSQGLTVLLDPHNYARYYGQVVGGPRVSDAEFADFWSRLSRQFKGNKHVWFGLVNEPHDMPTQQWLGAANLAIAAIRKTGAHNLILVPGNAYTGAFSWNMTWYGSPNALWMNNIKDPDNNYIYEVHQYLDKDSSGTTPVVMSPTIGSERLTFFTGWCRAHHKRAFLGEFAGPVSQESNAAVTDMLTYMEKNRDVWTGFCWWAAGGHWGNYLFSLEPSGGKDKPQMAVLRPFLQRHPASELR